MKRFSFLLSIICAFTFLTMPNVAISADNTTQTDQGTLTVSGTASDKFPPDTAIVTLAVETQAKTAAEAANQNSRKTRVIVDKLNSLINKKQGDSIQTSGYSVTPVYDYLNDQRRSVLTGYRVLNQVTVTTKQLANVSTIIDTAIANGANRVEGVSFTIDDREKYCQGILTKAAQKAQQEARIVAQALGVSIVGIKHISSSCGGEYPRPMYRMMAGVAEAGADAVSSTPIEAGEIQIQGNVNVEFYIK